MEKEEFIAITHFINPQLFWYQKVDGQNPEFLESKRIEDSIQQLYTAKQSAALQAHRPHVGEIVAIAFVSWNKFIRARVVHVVKFTKAEDEFIVWALDYGFPFQTKMLYIRHLPESHTKITGHICVGGIADVIPAELEFDFVTTSSQIVCKTSWSDRFVEMLEKVLNDAASISFIESFQVGEEEKQHFGDMKVITHSGSKFFVSEYLVKLNYAVQCQEGFREKLATMRTNRIPCWETNSRDIKVIDNKLNALNIEMGKFDLSGTMSESSCDTFSKQKVMDWCERNQNLNEKNEETTEIVFPRTSFDATDIEFDDSVSVKQEIEPINEDETVMGFAGKIHENRRKKYDGKKLPPMPAPGGFAIVSEKQPDKDEKSQPNSFTSGRSSRAKMLMDLKKAHSKTTEAQKNENILQKKLDQLNLKEQSDTGTEEFLENCKIKNAQTLQQQPQGTESYTNNSSKNSDNGSISSSTISKRKQQLMKIKEIYCKQIEKVLENNNTATDMHTLDDKTESRSQTGSKVSVHAQNLIDKRNKILLQRSQSDVSSSIGFPSEPKSVGHNQKQGYKMPQQSLKFSKLDFSKGLRQYATNSDIKPQAINQETPSEESEPKPEQKTAEEIRKMVNEDPFKNMVMVPAGFNVTKLVKRRDEDNHWHTKKTTLNDPIHSNYSTQEYQNCDGNNIARRTEDIEEDFFRLTRSRKERKKSDERHLLDSSFNDDDNNCPSELKSEDKKTQSPFKNSTQPRSKTSKEPHLLDISLNDNRCPSSARENDGSNIPETSYKNGNKSRATQREEKHLLDLSLNDSGCPPAITPEVVTDLLTFDDVKTPVKMKDEIKKDIFEEFNIISKLLDLSETHVEPLEDKSGSSDSFLKEMNQMNCVKDTSREKLLETSNATSEDSFDTEPKALVKLCPGEKKKSNLGFDGSSSSISYSSFKKLEFPIENKEVSVKKSARDQDYNYEASASSTSSGSLHKIRTKTKSSSHSSSSTQERVASAYVQSHFKDLPNDLEETKKGKPQSKSSSSTHSNDIGKESPQSRTSSMGSPLPSPCSTPVLTEKLNPPTSSTHSPKILNQAEYLRGLANSYLKSQETHHHLPEVSGEASLKTNFIQHLLLAHSKHSVTPIERMKNALFSAEIHQEMEHMRLTKMYRIQAYAWSHLVRGNCFCVINTNRTGKTWCYLPPVCSMLSFRMESKGLLQTCGAAVIIVAPSSVQVESIARHCRRLMASTTPKVSIVPAYGFRNTEEVKIELHNGCGVLVITPLCLQRLLEANDKEHLLNMQRVQTLIIDGLDSIMKENPDFDETLYKLVSPVLADDKIPFQLVVTSKMWTRRLINFLRIGNHPLLCIADYLEAAVYAKAKVSIKLQSSSEKMSVMMKCLDKCGYELERCVVLCNSVDEVLEVERCLQESGYMCMVYTEKMPPESADMINEWKEKTVCHQILITSDTVLPELMLQNIWTLIHYSMPMSWTKFNFRFSLFLNNYENLLATNFTKPTKVPKSLILLDENNNLQLPRLVEFMRNHNQLKHIHPDILNVAARVTAEREELRVQQGVLMCPKILEFGSCDESNRCPHRHQLTKYDGPAPGIPKSGEIRLKILEVLSPTHYIARILTQKQQGNWEVVRCSNEYATFSMKMSVHFMNEEARVIHWPPRQNDICVYKDGNNFHRCRLLEVPPILYESIVKLVNVKIKLIDSGSSIMCKSHDLLIIPEEFKDFPAQAIDIRLSSVVPFDNERVWDSKSTRTVKKWIVTDVTNNDVLQASINFVLMDIIWVNNVILMEQLHAIKGYALKINVKRSLLGRGFALDYDQIHSIKQTAMENGLLKPTSGITQIQKTDEEENLLEFSTASSEDKNVSNCGEILSPITSPKAKESSHSSVFTPVSVKKRESMKPKEEWAFLELDELSQAKIAELSNPCMFYLRLMNKEDDMQDLEEHIRSEKKLPLEDPHPMQNCLAPRDGRYHRAKIQRLIVDSDEGSVKARVFYCDTGLFCNLSLDKLRSSNKSIIEFIPFQAVCCKLTGIKVECEVDEILKVIQIEDSVHLAYAVKELPNNHEGFKTRNYEIILYECFTDKKDIQINKMLVEYGLASYNDETKHFLELETEVDFENFDYQEQDSYDFQSFLDRVKQQMDEEDEEYMNLSQQIIESHSTTPEEPKIVEITEETPNKMIESHRDDVDSHPPPLKALHKRPSTTWHETMCMIYLVIHAPDISDYHLEVHPKRLIFVATVNGELNVLLLNLLGYVRPELVTHEVRGLNVVVRLVKDLYMQWPRLLEDPTKFSWLSYNYNAIGLIEDEEMFGKSSHSKKKRLSCSSESSTDSRYSNPCETFTPIVNHDQMHDPMQDIY